MIVAFRAAAGRSVALEEVTVITPVFDVAIELTYLVGADVDATSQPHPFAAGRLAPVLACTVSVIEVRHADAAKTTSEIFARTV